MEKVASSVPDKPWYEQPWYRPVVVSGPVCPICKTPYYMEQGAYWSVIPPWRASCNCIKTVTTTTSNTVVSPPKTIKPLFEPEEADECTCHQCGGACQAEPAADVEDVKMVKCRLCDDAVKEANSLFVDFYGAFYQTHYICKNCANRISYLALERAFER